ALEPVGLCDERGKLGGDGIGIAAARHHLDAVAGRDDHALADGRAADESAQRGFQPAVGERDALAHLDRRGVMAQADEDDALAHDQNARPWIPNPSRFTLTSETTMTAKPAMVSCAAQRPRHPAVMRPWRRTV